MGIYKLGDVLAGKPEYGANLPGLEKGKYKYFRQSDLYSVPTMFVNKSKNKFMRKGDFFISRAGAVIDSYYHDSYETYVYAGYMVKYPINNKIAISKYIYLWSKSKGRKQILKFIKTGSTMPKFNPPVAKHLKIFLPSLKIQQKIIEIIEPHEDLFIRYNKCVRIDSIEHAKKDINTLIEIIEPIENIIENLEKQMKKINVIANLETISEFQITSDLYEYQKGSLPNGKIGQTPFLNVSAANGKINRFVSNKPNIFKGDITLSLDGNTGLVNNNLWGYNGYLFKVSHKNYKNYEIYYSLKHQINQRIIKINETGTTIKHSPRSKKEIKHIKFPNENLKEFFDQELMVLDQIKLLKNLKKKMITLLIK